MSGAVGCFGGCERSVHEHWACQIPQLLRAWQGLLMLLLLLGMQPACLTYVYPAAAAAAVQVESCKKRMNTFGFVGDLAKDPEVSCVYHSEEAENQVSSKGLGWVSECLCAQSSSMQVCPLILCMPAAPS